MVMEKILANKKKGDQTSLKSIKTTKKNFIIKLKITTFGTAANKRVTLIIEPS